MAFAGFRLVAKHFPVFPEAETARRKGSVPVRAAATGVLAPATTNHD
jgi:hypothetical protein